MIILSLIIIHIIFLMIRRPPRPTRMTHSFPTRRSSDLVRSAPAGPLRCARSRTGSPSGCAPACGLPDPRRLGEAPGIPSPASLLRRRAGFDLRPHPFAVPAASASHQGSMDERAVAAHDQAALRTQLHTPRNLDRKSVV